MDKRIEILARKYKTKLTHERQNGHVVTISDIMRVIECKLINNWNMAKHTRLYRLHGGEYCTLLEYMYCDIEMWKLMGEC